MGLNCIAPAASWLSQNTGLNPDERSCLAQILPTLVDAVASDAPTVITLGGAPGTGKSTLARLVADVLKTPGRFNEPLTPRDTLILSLDDYYLGRAERLALAATQHPIFEHRGVPGTQDRARLFEDLDAALAGTERLSLPGFDKSKDDRTPRERTWNRHGHPLCVLIEGWFLGVPAQAESSLLVPCNALEQRDDHDSRWRSEVNRELAAYHRAVNARSDTTWHLDAPGWNHVVEWRWRQEQELPRPALQSREAVVNFLAPFERIGNHMHETAASWADILIHLDAQHRPRLDSAP